MRHLSILYWFLKNTILGVYSIVSFDFWFKIFCASFEISIVYFTSDPFVSGLECLASSIGTRL